MHWLLRRLDSFIGTLFAATIGLAASQVFAFIQQYLQRLGGHLSEAERQHQQILTGALYETMDEATRAKIAQAAADRIADLREAVDTILNAGILTKPVAFFRHFDDDVALGTLSAFQPALPLDPSSLVYGCAGIFIGWLIYGAVKAPFVRHHARVTEIKKKLEPRKARPKIEPVFMPREPDQARRA